MWLMVSGLGCVLSAWSLEGLPNKDQQGTMPMSPDLNENPRQLGSGELHCLAHITAGRNKSCLFNYTQRGLWEAYAWCLLDSVLWTLSIWYFIRYLVINKPLPWYTGFISFVSLFLAYQLPEDDWVHSKHRYIVKKKKSMNSPKYWFSLLNLSLNNMKGWLKFD